MLSRLMGKTQDISTNRRRPCSLGSAMMCAAIACVLLSASMGRAQANEGSADAAEQPPAGSASSGSDADASDDGESGPEGAAETPPAPPPLEAPKLLQFVEAEYPAAAQEAKIEAAVELELTIAADGVVTDARVVTPVGQGFDEAALAAVQRFTFVPAKRNGEPIPARIRYRYVFELRPEPEPEAPAVGVLTGEIRGSDDDSPIASAEVVLAKLEGEGDRRAITGPDGRFSFDELEPGLYQVSVVAAEYGDFDATEEVVAGEETAVVYRIRMAGTQEPEAVAEFTVRAVVDAPPREVTRRTITREELTRVPGTRGDALRTVELLPGVGRPAFGGGQIIVRGSSPQDSQVFLNGVPVGLLYHFGGLTSFFNSRMLERIDFYPGNFSARFGRKMGGVLDVGSRDPAEDGLHGVVDINLLDSSFVVETPISENAGIAVAARRSYIDFFFNSVVPSDAFDVVAAPVYYDYQLLASYRPTPKDNIRALIYGSSDRFELIFAEPSDNNPDVNGELDLQTQFHKFQLIWSRELNDWLEQDLQVGVGPNQLRFGLGDLVQFELLSVPVDMRGEWRARLAPNLRLIAGIDTVVAPFEIKFSGPQPGQQEGSTDGEAGVSERGTIDVNYSGNVYRPAAYTEVDWMPIEPLRLVFGFRADWYREIKSWSFDPRFVAVWTATDKLRIKGGVGQFSQPPEFQETGKGLGNPDLTPMGSFHAGAGFEYDLADGMQVGMEGFYKRLWDRVVATENNEPPFFTNEGKGRIYGLEVSGRVQPKGRPYFGFLSYTLSRSERKDRGNEPWRLFDFDQTHILSVAGVYQFGGGWEAGATFRFVSGNPYTPIEGGVFNANTQSYNAVLGAVNSARNPNFNRLDLRVEKAWEFESWKLAAYLDVQNVYNATNPEGRFYNYDYTKSSTVPGLPIIPSLGLRGEM